MPNKYFPDENVAEIPELHDSQEILEVTKEIESTEKLNSTLPLMIIKCLTVPTAAMFSSLSLPLTIMVLDKRFLTKQNSHQAQRFVKTLTPYAFLAGFRSLLLWYKIGQRLDGKADTNIEAIIDSQQDANIAVAVGLIANLSAITNGMLVMFLVLQDARPELAGSAAVALGLLNYATDLVTDVADGFRKYVEHQHAAGKHIRPFFKQSYIQKLFQYKVSAFGLLLREVLPVITGIIRSQTTTQITSTLLADKIPAKALTALNLLLGITVYESCAYFAKFDVIQLHENLKAANLTNFSLENSLVSSGCKPVRIIGKFANGQLLVDTLQNLKLSSQNAVNVTFVFAAIGLMALIFTGMQAYVSSTDSQAVADDKQGLLFNYYDKRANDLAPQVLFANISIAVILGIASTFAQSGTIKKYASSAQENQIIPDIENEAEIRPSIL